jgi:hypothetical protein
MKHFPGLEEFLPLLGERAGGRENVLSVLDEYG